MSAPARCRHLAVLLLAWWVFAGGQAVLGPFASRMQCIQAADDYAKAHAVPAVCAWDWPTR